MSATIKAKFKEGSVLGGILLIAGSCIGAGMLALPVVTGIAGFAPSVLMFVFSWLFMSSTGLLLLEANLAVGHDLSLISIAEKTLGKIGKVWCWVLFLFLFYSLSVAYIAASGSILRSIFADLFGIEFPAWGGSLLFTSVFGIVLYIGTKHVDYVNRLLMSGLVASYCILIITGAAHIHPSYLTHLQWGYAFAALPVLIISFGFHNMIPSLAMYMKGDVKRLRITVLIGSALPLLIYLLWELVMLGIIPIRGREGLLHALDQGEVATQALRAAVGHSWVNNIAQIFALFAIITSFLAQSLSLVDFLSDGLKISKVGIGRLTLILIALVPPFAFAFLYPHAFIKALNLAGGFSAVILFGIIPVLMVWKLRSENKEKMLHLLPFGRFFMFLIMAIAVGIFIIELAKEFGLPLFPKAVS